MKEIRKTSSARFYSSRVGGNYSTGFIGSDKSQEGARTVLIWRLCRVGGHSCWWVGEKAGAYTIFVDEATISTYGRKAEYPDLWMGPI